MNSKLILSAAAAAVLFSACRKDNVAPDTRAVLGYQLTVADPSAAIQGKVAADGAIQWTAGYAYPHTMRFGVKADGSKYSENHVTDYRTLDTARIDLFAQVAEGFGHVALAQEIYKEVELRIELKPRAVYPALQLKGTYTSSMGTAALPVTLQVFDGCEIKTEVKDISIDKKTNFDAVTTLNLSALSNGITETMIANAELTDGTLLISNTTNRELYNVILGNLTNNRHAVQVSQR